MITRFFNWVDGKTKKLSINSFLLSYEEGIDYEDVEVDEIQSLIYSEVFRVGRDKRLINKEDFEINKNSGKIVIFKDIKGKKYKATQEEFYVIREGISRLSDKSDVFISFLYLPNESSPKKPKVLCMRLYLHSIDYQLTKNKY